MTDFVVQGPYVIDSYQGRGGRHISKEDGRSFFAEHAELAKERGCYIFATRAGRGYTPWYVGRATRSFSQECFHDHKLTKYHECLADMVKCTPVMFFVTVKNTRSQTSNIHIKEVEQFLIQHAVAANPDLTNVQGVKKRWSIAGVVRSGAGRASVPALTLKRALKIT
jgi:hypothetical protein